MTIYLDLLFLFNFFVNLVFLVVIETIYKSKIKKMKVVFGGLVGGFIVVFSLFYNNFDMYLKIFGGILICVVGMEKLEGFRNIAKYSSFYTLNLASVGFVQAFEINTHYLVFFGLTAIILLYLVESNKNLIIFLNQLKYNIIVNFHKTSLRLVGYLDTGNFSEYDGYPIIYVSSKYYPKELLFRDYIDVRIATVNTTSNLKAYEPVSCIIEVGRKKKEIKVLVVFCDLKSVDCLMNVKMLLWGG